VVAVRRVIARALSTQEPVRRFNSFLTSLTHMCVTRKMAV